MDYPSVDSDHVAKRKFPIRISDEANLHLPLSVTPPGNGDSQVFDDLPKTVVRNLTQGSSPMSMDFHPLHLTLLLVGDIALWEVASRERLVLRNFRVWELSACSMPLQAALVKDPIMSINRVIWSPDGSLCGVAYSTHIVQIYSYHGGEDIRQHLEIDAHVGGVNDIAFSTPNKKLCVITCGDDKTIKVWDAATGTKQYTFEGHEAPVYSVCRHYKENIQFIFSTAVDGKIKAWLYDNLGSRVDYDAPDRWCTRMAYSQDEARLFSCGTSKDGESHIVEWNESEGAVKRTYLGFRKRSLGVVQFDTTKNRYLAAGDDFSIKFWYMDNVQLLTSIDADGGLPNGDVKSRILEETNDKSKIWKLCEISEPSHCRPLRLHDHLTVAKISRLIYTTSGNGILALASNAFHLLWKWHRNKHNSSGKASTSVSPQLWQPSSGILMTNDVSDASPEEAVPCFALSKNDSYLVSASGGKISLFNMMTFKTMTAVMPPPPAATFLAFLPRDNNIIAIGMDDSTILIYNVRVIEVKSKLKGHSKRISGLAFSRFLHVLVSSGADAQICVWSSISWEKLCSKFLPLAAGRAPTAPSDTNVQFHQDHAQFLVVHETQLAIFETKQLECVKQWVP